MNSPFANLFLQLQQHIKNAVPAIVHIDQDLGQLDYYQQAPAVSYPCVLIDLDAFTATNYSEQAQQLTGNVIFRLAFAPYSSSGADVPPLYQEKALSFYETEYQLHQALQGYTAGDYFSSLCRLQTQTEKREDNIRVRKITYSVSIEDYSLKTPLDTAVVNSNIKLEV